MGVAWWPVGQGDGRSPGMTQPPPSPDGVAALRHALDRLDHRLDREAAIGATSLGELRRQYKAAPRRRGGPGSLEAQGYALGSVLMLVGAGEVDDTALLGLLAHPIRMLRWMAEAVAAGAGPKFGDVVTAVLADPARHGWCGQWGRILQWRRRKPLYDAAVASFLASGRTGEDEAWRALPPTDGQMALATTLAALLGDPVPDLATRGEAFAWIFARGGNPAYWQEPPLPPELEAGHD